MYLSSSLLFFPFPFFLFLSLLRLDSTPTSCHRNEQPTLSLRTLHCFVHLLPVSVRRKSLSHSQTSFFQPYTTDTDKYIFIYEIQTYTDSSSLIFSISFFDSYPYSPSRKFFLSKSPLSLSLPFSVCYYTSLLDLPLCV